MRIEFTKVCETGIQQIDNQHKQFFEYINSAFAAIESSDEEAVILAKNLVKKLREYADTHFAAEEAYMQSIHDAELLLQITEHNSFRKKIDEMIAKGTESKKDLEDIIKFLTKWLYSHILTSDTMIGKQKNNGKYEFTKEFYTNIPLIDEEHANLFDIIGRAWDVLEDDMIFDKYDKILSILNELRVYTQKHFTDEEEYMKTVKYSGYADQKVVHEAFIDKVVNLDLSELEDMDEQQDEYIKELLEFLTDWLINHILRMDKKIPQS